MTRENKLALVIGFGLLLFVGILVSDHFSVARMQMAADLRPAEDPLNQARHEDPMLLDLGGRAAVAANVRNAENATSRDGQESNMSPVPRNEVSRMDMPDLQTEVPLVDLSDGVITSTPSSETIHVIGKGESLTSICRTYFDDPSLVKKLAAYNGLDNPDKIRQGQKIRVPHAELLGVTTQGSVMAQLPENFVPVPDKGPQQRVAAGKGKTYTVQEGDILSEIARKTMGSGRKWHVLYTYNEAVIDDPDRLDVGTVLRIPPG
jgi:nucleoid-associated protein YgaU